MTLGIDLGTTYSVGAYIDDDNTPQVITNSEGNTMTPSVVLLDTEDEIIVGDVAKDNVIIRPNDVISVIKNDMGKKIVVKEAGGKKYTPEMISSFIIRKIVQDAEQATGEKVTNVVITVPAYFKDSQRKATEDAATIAGVPLSGMINEPTAAALCYVHKNHIENERIMVYDLGGGTFDVTILNIRKSDDIEVMSTGGLSNAGGRFFDQAIVDHVRDYMEEKHDIDLEDDEYIDELQELYIKAEKAKMQLSNKNTVAITIKIGKIRESIEITREMFNQMINNTYEKTERKMKEAIAAAGLQIAEIDKILLVGGSSRIPYIAERIQQFAGKEPSKEINPDEAVAIGAALYAKTNIRDDKTPQFTDVCSHSIGVVVINDRGQEENEKIIMRNSKLPIEKQERFRTVVANQKKIDLSVTEGEYQELTDVTIIGNFEIDLPEGVPQNALIVLTISLDIKQLIHIHISLPDINFEQEYRMRRIANMDEETVAHVTGMLRDVKVS